MFMNKLEDANRRVKDAKNKLANYVNPPAPVNISRGDPPDLGKILLELAEALDFTLDAVDDVLDDICRTAQRAENDASDAQETADQVSDRVDNVEGRLDALESE